MTLDRKIIKISAFLLIFLVLLQFLVNSYMAYSKYKNLKNMEKLNDFSLVISSLVHNIQQEREGGIRYLENKNSTLKQMYNVDIQNTNKAIKLFNKYLKNNNLNFTGFKKELLQINEFFKILDVEREKIKSHKESILNEIKFYSKLNQKLLSVLHVFVKKATDTKLVKALMGYLAFERLKESIGLERSILYVTFLNNKWNQKLYVKYIQILTRQQVFSFQALMMANNDIRDFYYKVMQQKFINKVHKIEKIAMYKQTNFGISSEYAYNIMTKKIKIMKLLDKKYYQRNIYIINEIKQNLFLKVLVNLGLSLIVILFVLYNLALLHKENKTLIDKVIYDSLTGVYTRMFFISKFEVLKSEAEKNNKKIAVIFIDLDGFKAVNDTLGHKIGDEVLKEVANRLQHIVKKSDIIARFGGDEFLIMINDVDDMKILEQILQNILREIKKPIIINNKIADVSASIGVSIFPDDGEDIETLLKYADKNMYISKNSGKDRFTLQEG